MRPLRKKRRTHKPRFLDYVFCFTGSPRLTRNTAGPRDPAPLMFAGLILVFGLAFVVYLIVISVDPHGTRANSEFSWPFFPENQRPATKSGEEEDWKNSGTQSPRERSRAGGIRGPQGDYRLRLDGPGSPTSDRGPRTSATIVPRNGDDWFNRSTKSP